MAMPQRRIRKVQPLINIPMVRRTRVGVGRVLLLALTIVAPTFAIADEDGHVVVLDVQAVLQRSQLYGNLARNLEDDKDYLDRRERFQALQAERQELSERLRTEQLTLSQPERTDLARRLSSKETELRLLVQQVEETGQQLMQQTANELVPLMQQVISELARTQGYRLIVQRQSVVIADPSLDITETVVELVDAAWEQGDAVNGAQGQ